MGKASPSFPFRSPASRDIILRQYDEALARLGAARHERDVMTGFGHTHVVSFGPEDGEPLFLLHGATANAAMLSDLIENYAREGFRVHAPDVPGHGGRSEPRQLSWDCLLYTSDAADERSSVDLG